ncbi:MAG TPA: hypothetical protein VJC05_04245 [Candidatus Andersenbacteria bacterium]|nr:hypothetical protein [Candidatus Andersenbacteria bacterium]
MVENPYLDQHTYVHYVERWDGTEEILGDRREEVCLTTEGETKQKELRDLLYSGVPRLPGILHVLMFGSIAVVVCGAILGTLVARSFFPGIDWVVPFLIGAFLGWSVCIVGIAGFFRWARMRFYQNAVPVVQFIEKNPEFMAALEAVGERTARTAQQLVLWHQQQSAA